MAACLEEIVAGKKFHMVIEEIDIVRRMEDDLSLPSKQEEFLRQIREGRWDAVICAPPCSTWSRVRAANLRGPPPVRDRNYPWGYPRVKRKFQQEVALGNTLVEFTIKVVEAVLQRPEDQLPFFLAEHPEDLGAVIREEDGAKLWPASIWQLEQLRKLVQGKLQTVAINQCCWGTAWRKPTRLSTTSEDVAGWGPNEWPTFDEDGFYTGPLARSCQCTVTTSLAKRSNEEGFRTTGTSNYPYRLDKAIAEAIVKHCQLIVSKPPKVGRDRLKHEEQRKEGEELEQREERRGSEDKREETEIKSGPEVVPSEEGRQMPTEPNQAMESLCSASTRASVGRFMTAGDSVLQGGGQLRYWRRGQDNHWQQK